MKNKEEISAEGIYKRKLAALEGQGGKVIRSANIVRMPDGRECCIDYYGRCVWITKPA